MPLLWTGESTGPYYPLHNAAVSQELPKWGSFSYHFPLPDFELSMPFIGSSQRRTTEIATMQNRSPCNTCHLFWSWIKAHPEMSLASDVGDCLTQSLGSLGVCGALPQQFPHFKEFHREVVIWAAIQWRRRWAVRMRCRYDWKGGIVCGSQARGRGEWISITLASRL